MWIVAELNTGCGGPSESLNAWGALYGSEELAKAGILSSRNDELRQDWQECPKAFPVEERRLLVEADFHWREQSKGRVYGWCEEVCYQIVELTPKT